MTKYIEKIYNKWVEYKIRSYESKAPVSWGTDVSLVTTGDKYNWNDKKLYIVQESDITQTTTKTKWTAPYNVDYYYTNVQISDNAGVEWKEWAIYIFNLSTLSATSSYRNVRLRIWSGSYIPLMSSAWVILSGSTYRKKSYTKAFYYSTKYESNWALHMLEDDNTTYSSMSQAEIDTWTATTARSITATNLRYAIATYWWWVDTSWKTATSWATLTVWDLRTKFTPSANFTISCWTVNEWELYIVKITNWTTVYVMSLWTWVNNPFEEDLTLKKEKEMTITLLALSSSALEIQNIKTEYNWLFAYADLVNLSTKALQVAELNTRAKDYYEYYTKYNHISDLSWLWISYNTSTNVWS